MSKPKKSRRFDYNLESVLRIRNVQEKMEQDKYAHANQKYIQEQQKEEEIKLFQREKYDELKSILDGGQKISNFQHVLMRKSHLDIVKEQVEEQERVRVEAEEKKEEQRAELIKAGQKRQVLDKDKSKKRESWKKLMDREQVKVMDDITSSREARKKKRGM